MCSGCSGSRCSFSFADVPITPSCRECHFFFVGWILSETVSSAPWRRFSARFSLMDFPDFLDMLWRGDLSLMADLSEWKPEWLRVPTLRRSPGQHPLDRALGRSAHSAPPTGGGMTHL